MKIAFLRPNMGGKRSNDAIEPLAFAVLSGLTDKTINDFGLGYSVKSPNASK